MTAPTAMALKSAPVSLPDLSAAKIGKTRAAARKPASFTSLGQSYSAASWPQLLVTLCQLMAERHPNEFVSRALQVRGPRRQHIASTPDGMISLASIGISDLWLEANQSATSA